MIFDAMVFVSNLFAAAAAQKVGSTVHRIPPRALVPKADSDLKLGGQLVAFFEEHAVKFEAVPLMTDDQWSSFLKDRLPNCHWRRWYGKTQSAIYSVVVIEDDPSNEPWTRFKKAVRIADELLKTGDVADAGFRFLFPNEQTSTRFLTALPAKLRDVLLAGKLLYRGPAQTGDHGNSELFQTDWNQVRLSVAEGKELLNHVIRHGGKICGAFFEAPPALVTVNQIDALVSHDLCQNDGKAEIAIVRLSKIGRLAIPRLTAHLLHDSSTTQTFNIARTLSRIAVGSEVEMNQSLDRESQTTALNALSHVLTKWQNHRTPEASLVRDQLERAIRSLNALATSPKAAADPSTTDFARPPSSPHKDEDVAMPDTIWFDCPNCANRVHAPAPSAGRHGRCPKCQHQLTVPHRTTAKLPLRESHQLLTQMSSTSGNLPAETNKAAIPMPVQVMDTFESHLRNVARVKPRTPSYAVSDYSSLLEAMTISFLARAAFIDHHWNTDVCRMLARWLSPSECKPFFDGDLGFFDAICDEMRLRAKKWYNTPQGELQAQYLDLEGAICEAHPDFNSGSAFG